ncbi:GNAT family N-acetyltransferase [Lacticaseibacillus kribbianus]|uniref:GNAT family N-acetyltransferase n=1 Tax=Lacticaseibacillus kribbianus TaxID=2926292 RepID=UPI001CD6A663|nr:GNAT family N-acetyltransferase [Lacticaseibacillus kribbianus]
MRIREMRETDIDAINAGFAAMGWPGRPRVLAQYLAEQAAGSRRVFVAEVAGQVAGYLTLLPKAPHGPWAGQLPELADFNVFAAFRQAGVGTSLMAAAETAAGLPVTLGVGLHPGYGPAQRLYVRRGYVPDGSGAWLDGRRPVAEDEVAPVADLVLYMIKER